MNRTKITALSLASLLFAAGASFAGPGHHEGKWDGKKMEKKIEKKIDRMSKDLDLTKEQKTQVESLIRAKHEQRRAEMKKMMEKKKAERAEFHKEMKAILTPEQFEKFEEHARKKMEKMDKKREKMRKKKE